MKISKDVKYIGVNDYTIDLFEGQFPVAKGMSYNSYLILDEKIAVMDTVDRNFTEEWFTKLQDQLQERTPDYLIVQHMEPDHSANIAVFMERYPKAVVVSSAPSFTMMKNYFGQDYKERRILVKEGSLLSLGKHELQFITAPMVHWPEVIVTYDSCDKILFSADGFGKFGALDAEEEWKDEARRYYMGIVSKFGSQVQDLLKKVSGLEIQTICPLHGPVLTENLEYYIGLYDIWSSYSAEEKGTAIVYNSVYGHTREAVELLAEELKTPVRPDISRVNTESAHEQTEEKTGEKVQLFDLARCDTSEALAAAFRYDKLVLAATTYNAGIFPSMQSFIHALIEHNYQNRRVALIENGSWAPVAARVMQGMLAECKDITFMEHMVRIKAALNEESKAAIKLLAEEIKIL